MMIIIIPGNEYPLSTRLIADILPNSQNTPAGDQPRLIQGIRSGDGVGEDQETTA